MHSRVLWLPPSGGRDCDLRLLPQIEPHADHRAPRIHEQRWHPKVGLNRLSVASASSAVSLSRLSTSSRQLDTSLRRTEASSRRAGRAATATRSRREPRGSSRMRWSPCGERHLRGRRPRLAAEVLQVGGHHEARSRHVDGAHHAEDVRPIVRQPAVRIRQVVRIAPERVGRGDRAELRAVGGPPLETCSPDVRENVYDPMACQPFDRRLSSATTRPL